MKDDSSPCPATLRNGKPCSYKGKSKYKGFCGAHARLYLATETESRDARLALLVATGAALIEISIKAHEYLPKLVELVISSRYVGFVEPSAGTSAFEGTELKRKNTRDIIANETVTQIISPKEIPYNIASLLRSRDWKNLANHLSYDFDVLLSSGSLPEDLLREVKSRRGQFQALLSASGFNPGLHTADHPKISRIIED